MKIVSLLPMKSNSERIPNKNLKSFCGRPLYHRICSTLLSSKYISEIVVNTDCPNIISDIKLNFPTVRIIKRPKEICGDFVDMNEIIAYDLSETDGDFYLQTHSTNPLITVNTLDCAIESFLELSNKIDSLFSVTKLQMRLYWEDGKPINHNPNELIRTQDLPLIYEENSCLYLFSEKSFLEAGNKRIGLRPHMFSIDKLEAIDIDNQPDFIIAEQLYGHLRRNEL